MLKYYKKEFAEKIQKISINLSFEEILDNVEIVPSNVQGDLGFPCFKLSKELKKSPNQIAEDFVKEIDDKNIIAVGPYINYTIPTKDFAEKLILEIKNHGDNFGKLEKNGQEVVLEGWQANTHKAFHIGHLRNALISESISSCLKWAGYTVHPVAYPGDIGAHVAKWIWYYINFYQGDMPTENFGEWAGKLYSQATNKLEENLDKYKPEVEDLQKKLEDGDIELNEIWKETREKCLLDFQDIFDELACDIQKRYYESDVEKLGIEKVQKLLDSKIAKIGEGGAVIMDLEKYNLGIFLLLKSTGASLYSTKDIGLAYLKKEDFPKYLKSIYIVGSEQEYHFNQLFKTLELMGFPHDQLKHVSYGLVDLKDGKMSSRAGNVILYTELRDQLLFEAQKILKTRDFDQEKKDKIARQVAFSAMKFDMLLPDASKKILFDPSQALSFEGETGPYLQYTHARASSLLKKGNLDLSQFDGSDLNEENEKNILIHLAQLSDYIFKSAEEYKPNYVARYLLDLSKLFNSYYNNTSKKITDSDSALALVFAVRQVLKNGLSILGIDASEEM
ncbi:MAG: arginine--tRNA ligase [Candidatus Absconditabacterales bacterium]|nr:arginine--tRNA ligase [Candidatus Absconditabacterales bacterium]